MNNKDLKKFYTPFLLLGWVVLMIGMIAMVSYAGGRDKTMNEIALEATTSSFYDEQVALWHLPDRDTLERMKLAEVEDSKILQEKHEQIMEEYADIQSWLYYEPQAPKTTCISNYDRWLDDRVQYAYDLGGIDFVGTIAQESMFDPSAVGDQWNSFWFCQLHAYWHSDKIREYKALGTNEAKLEYCYKVYKGYIDAGNIQNRLYGYNVRQNGLAKLGITCE